MAMRLRTLIAWSIGHAVLLLTCGWLLPAIFAADISRPEKLPVDAKYVIDTNGSLVMATGARVAFARTEIVRFVWYGMELPRYHKFETQTVDEWNASLPYWACNDLAALPVNSFMRWESDVAVGWPFRFMYCRVRIDWPSDVNTTSTIAVDGGKLLQAGMGVFPLVPAWRGVVGNVVVGGMIGMLIYGLFAWGRSKYYQWQNRCAWCGYLLKGLAGSCCPECGRSVL